MGLNTQIRRGNVNAKQWSTRGPMGSNKWLVQKHGAEERGWVQKKWLKKVTKRAQDVDNSTIIEKPKRIQQLLLKNQREFINYF